MRIVLALLFMMIAGSQDRRIAGAGCGTFAFPQDAVRRAREGRRTDVPARVGRPRATVPGALRHGAGRYPFSSVCPDRTGRR